MRFRSACIPCYPLGALAAVTNSKSVLLVASFVKHVARQNRHNVERNCATRRSTTLTTSPNACVLKARSAFLTLILPCPHHKHRQALKAKKALDAKASEPPARLGSAPSRGGLAGRGLASRKSVRPSMHGVGLGARGMQPSGRGLSGAPSRCDLCLCLCFCCFLSYKYG